MNSWKVIFATAVIFGAGVLTGGLLVNYTNHSRPKNFHHASELNSRLENHGREQRPAELPMPPMAQKMNKQFLAQLDDRLHLAPGQYDKIKKIIAEGQERNHEIWTNAAPKMRAVMQDVHQKIREQLTPGQKKPFEELLKQFRPARRSQNTNAPAK
ncbi:MAG: hypothetical protein ACREFE_15670 [Limisphaerales bacterium]